MSSGTHSLKGRKTFKSTAFIILMFLGCLAVYSNTFHAPFAFDDYPFILNNKPVHITEISFDSLAGAACEGKARQRPLSNISFAFNFYFGNYQPFGYHVVNIFIHLLSGIFLFFLIRQTLVLPFPFHDKNTVCSSLTGISPFNLDIAAFFAVLVWLVHPIHVESVTYICQRMTSMAGLFYILALLFYVKGRLTVQANPKSSVTAGLFFLGCLVSGMLSIAAKPNAATIPVMIFFYEWFFFQNLSTDRIKRRFVWIGVAAIVFCIFCFIFLGNTPIDRILSAYTHRDFTLFQRVLTESRVVLYYISLIFFPYYGRFNLDYNYPLSDALIAPPTTFLAMLAIVGLFSIVVYSARRDRFVVFGILWFLTNLAIESSVIGLEIIFEHRTYLPSMFFIPVVVLLCFRYIRSGWVVMGLLCLLIVIESVWTYQRNEIWQDGVSLWDDCIQKSPQKARPHYNLGCALVKQNLNDKTIKAFEKAVQLNPDFSTAHYNLGYAMAQKQMYDQAIVHFNKALTLDPDYAQAHNNLANALSKNGRRPDLALKHYRLAVKLKPDNAEFHTNLGAELFSRGSVNEAITHYQKALALAPSNVKILNRLGYALFCQGNFDKAMLYYLKALDLAPDNAETLGKIGDVLLKENRIDDAIDYYIKALKINPTDAQSHYNLGIAYYQIGEKALAIYQIKEAKKISPNLLPPEFMQK